MVSYTFYMSLVTCCFRPTSLLLLTSCRYNSKLNFNLSVEISILSIVLAEITIHCFMRVKKDFSNFYFLYLNYVIIGFDRIFYF